MKAKILIFIYLQDASPSSTELRPTQVNSSMMKQQMMGCSRKSCSKVLLSWICNLHSLVELKPTQVNLSTMKQMMSCSLFNRAKSDSKQITKWSGTKKYSKVFKRPTQVSSSQLATDGQSKIKSQTNWKINHPSCIASWGEKCFQIAKSSTPLAIHAG